MSPLGVAKGLRVDLKLSLDRDDSGGEGRGFSWFHLNDHAIEEQSTWAKAAFLVVAHQHKLLDTGILENGRRQNEPTQFDRFFVEFTDLLGDHLLFELTSFFDVELQIIEGDFATFASRISGLAFLGQLLFGLWGVGLGGRARWSGPGSIRGLGFLGVYSRDNRNQSGKQGKANRSEAMGADCFLGCTDPWLGLLAW